MENGRDVESFFGKEINRLVDDVYSVRDMNEVARITGGACQHISGLISIFQVAL